MDTPNRYLISIPIKIVLDFIPSILLNNRRVREHAGASTGTPRYWTVILAHFRLDMLLVHSCLAKMFFYEIFKLFKRFFV